MKYRICLAWATGKSIYRKNADRRKYGHETHVCKIAIFGDAESHDDDHVCVCMFTWPRIVTTRIWERG